MTASWNTCTARDALHALETGGWFEDEFGENAPPVLGNLGDIVVSLASEDGVFDLDDLRHSDLGGPDDLYEILVSLRRADGRYTLDDLRACLCTLPLGLG